MTTLSLDDDELKTVEQTLARLAQLSSSIQSLKMDIIKSNPLPPPSSLQASAQILQRNLQTVLDSLSENNDLFNRMAIHPATNYPGRTQEGVLTQLLRKKLEPEVEELVVAGREAASLTTVDGIISLEAIWDEVRQWTHQRIATYVRDEAGQVFTVEERKGGVELVRTGLKRALDEESDEEEEDDDDDVDVDDDDDDDDDDDNDEEEEVGHVNDEGVENNGEKGRKKSKLPRGPELETLLWFSEHGDFELPSNVEYERKVGVRKGLEGVNIPAESSSSTVDAVAPLALVV